MNNERKTLVSIPVWGILLIILMIISVIVLVKTFIDLKKESVEITDTTYMDEPVLDLIDKVDDFLMNNTVVTETIGVPNSLTSEDRKEIYDAAKKRTEDRKNSIVYVNKVHDQMAVKIVEEEARNLLTEYIKEYIMFKNNNVGTYPELLIKLGLETEENVNKLLEDNRFVEGEFKTNVKYNDFKSAMLNLVSEEYFENHFSFYIEYDGYVCVNNGAGEYVPFEFVDLKCLSYDDETKTYVYDVKIKDLEMYEHKLDGEDISDDEIFANITVILKRINNKLVIDVW